MVYKLVSASEQFKALHAPLSNLHLNGLEKAGLASQFSAVYSVHSLTSSQVVPFVRHLYEIV